MKSFIALDAFHRTVLWSLFHRYRRKRHSHHNGGWNHSGHN